MENKTVTIRCTHCGGTMTVDESNSEILMCPYCGSKEITRESDELKIKRIEKEIELKKMEMEEQERKRKYEEKEKDRKNTNKMLIGCVVVWLALMGIVFLMNVFESKEDEVIQLNDPNMAAVAMSSSSYCEKNYQQATDSLKKSGFTNIKCEPVYDIYLGVFSTEGEVDSITINDIAEFSKNDVFPKDAEIVITYHLSYKKDPNYSETAATTSKNKNDNNDTRPQKNSFDENTAQKVISGNYTIPVPDYFEPSEVEKGYRGYAETGWRVSMLDIYSETDTTDPATFEVLYDDKDNMVKVLSKSIDKIGNCEFIGYDIYETDELKGMIFNFSFVFDEYDITGKSLWFVFPSEKDNKWIYIVLMCSDNTKYNYEEDFIKMIDAIKKNDGSADIATTASKALSYSTNDKETAKNGNSGVFSYRSKGGTYYIYYIIDFDEGYVYRFVEGNGDETCDRLKIESGDLNKGLIVTYHDGDDTWSNGLHFCWQNQSDHLILEDDDHFEYDFYSTDLTEAQRIKDKKRIIDY